MFVRILEVAVVPVVVAFIGAAGAIFSAVKKMRQENTEQHGQNAELLHHLSGQIGGIDRKVDRLDERLDKVQQWASDHEIQHLTEEAGH